MIMQNSTNPKKFSKTLINATMIVYGEQNDLLNGFNGSIQ